MPANPGTTQFHYIIYCQAWTGTCSYQLVRVSAVFCRRHSKNICCRLWCEGVILWCNL